MITDTINKDWLLDTTNLADAYEAGEVSISEFTNDQLHWLIYFNWGNSGAYQVPETTVSLNELAARGVVYNGELAELIENKTQQYY